MTSYQVIEDNGGGLHLFTFNGNDVVRGFSDLEHLSPEDFAASLDTLKNGGDAGDWDGQMENPQEQYEHITSYEYGWEIVADEDNVYPDKMGRAAQMAFGVESE